MTNSKVNAFFGLSVIRAVTRNAEPLCEVPDDRPSSRTRSSTTLPWPEPFISEIGVQKAKSHRDAGMSALARKRKSARWLATSDLYQ